MSEYKTIAVVYGSDSSECEVSCRSGEYVASRIDDTRFDVYEIYARFGKWQLVAAKKKHSMRVTFPESSRPEIDKTDFSVNVLGEKVKFDFVYIMQHGTPGENGLLQGYLEMLKIPFSSCGASVSAIVFDKYACKSYVHELDIVKCAPDIIARKGMDLDERATLVGERLQYPVFVKPTSGGSSFGITKVKDPRDLITAIKFAFREDPTVIIEQGISGRELTCAVYRDGNGVETLPLIEIVTRNEYFDYDAKYNGNSQEICPAPVEDEVRMLVQDTASKLYVQLGCSGLVRIDFIYAPDGLYFLEVNTIPGMTSASLVPKMVRTAGMDITDFLSTIIDNA